jgi:hypothetical protein
MLMVSVPSIKHPVQFIVRTFEEDVLPVDKGCGTRLIVSQVDQVRAVKVHSEELCVGSLEINTCRCDKWRTRCLVVAQVEQICAA